MERTLTGATGTAVEATAALLLSTAVSDALGFGSISFLLLVLGVPVSAAAGLVCLARVIDGAGPVERLQAALAALLLVAILVGAATRSPAHAEPGAPPFATAALAAAFVFLLLQAVLALADR